MKRLERGFISQRAAVAWLTMGVVLLVGCSRGAADVQNLPERQDTGGGQSDVGVDPADSGDARGSGAQSQDMSAAATCDSSASIGYHCGDHDISGGSPNTLYYCDGAGPATVAESCADECVVAGSGFDDYCKMPPVGAASCDSNAVQGYYCDGDKVSGGEADTLYRCAGPGPATVEKACSGGCIVAPAGYDDYCAESSATCDANASTGDYCGGDKVSNGEADTLYQCNGPGPATVKERCANGCTVAPAGQDDYCEAAAATCDADAATGDYCGGDKVSNGRANTLYSCNGPGPATVKERCTDGCTVAPAGQDDFCESSATGWRWPVSPKKGITNSYRSGHYARDFEASNGAEVRAVADGTVTWSGYISSACGYGLIMKVDGMNLYPTYEHIKNYKPIGARVSKGDIIARVGPVPSPGSCWTGYHLHLGVQKQGAYLESHRSNSAAHPDPCQWIDGC